MEGSEAYKIIFQKQPYQLLNTNREFLPSCGISNCHENFRDFSKVRSNAVSILYFILIEIGPSVSTNGLNQRTSHKLNKIASKSGLKIVWDIISESFSDLLQKSCTPPPTPYFDPARR